MRGRLPFTATYTGDGSTANTFKIGFKARYVKVVNYTDADVTAEYFAGMPDASAILTIDSGSGTTDMSKITTAGITVGETSITIGTNANLVENAKVFYVVAF